VNDLMIALTTLPENRADEVARALVDERLAACVNVLATMVSTYRWKGTVETDREQQLVIKTTAARLAELEQRLRQLHPYELPEFIVLRPDAASSAYSAWVGTETRPTRP
jgi:periplasmic divalent cation tolerance protein